MKSGAHHEPGVSLGAHPVNPASETDTGGAADVGGAGEPEHIGVMGHLRHLVDPSHHHDLQGRMHDGVQEKHERAVRWLGKIGWQAKGVVYAILGYLCCKMGGNGELADTSPQGAFVLLGSGKAGKGLLLVEMGGVALYICWRFWEGITAQGSHPAYSKFKNFFSFRLSPLVSGIVYCSYLIYCCTLVPKTFKNQTEDATQSDFTRSLHSSWYGRVLLVFLGLAFTAAFVVQVEAVVTRKFHREIKPQLWKTLRWATIISGHIGSAGRGAFFLMVAILMYRSVSDDNLGSKDQNSFGNALSDLRTSKWGRTILFFIGFGLLVYGLYATLVAFVARQFPTPGPTDTELAELRVSRDQNLAEKEALQVAEIALRDEHIGAGQPLSGSSMPEALPGTVTQSTV